MIVVKFIDGLIRITATNLKRVVMSGIGRMPFVAR